MSSAGERVGGRYRLVAELGSGGMGRVWKAHDETLDVDVAIKEVQLEPSDSTEERAQRLTRAHREARTAAQLRDHPHVVAVYDVLIEDERPWIVMSLVHGTSLAELVGDRGALAEPAARQVAGALLSALTAAHKAGIVHRDVKPENVLLGEDGTVLLGDFGIAKRVADTVLTGTAASFGSLEYVAPERARGGADEPPGDLFSLGATLYLAVTGTSPFRREHPAASLAAVLSDLPPHPGAAGVVADLIMDLLAKEPADRPTAAQALARLGFPEPALPLLAAPAAPANPPEEAQPPMMLPNPSAGIPAPALPIPALQPVDAATPTILPNASMAIPTPPIIPPQPVDAAPPQPVDPAPLAFPAAAPTPVPAVPADSMQAPQLTAMQLPVELVQLPVGSRALLITLAFSPDGRVLAGAGSDGTVRLWHTGSGERMSTLPGHVGGVHCLAFSPDGGLLASGGADGRIRVWDLRYGRHLVLTGHVGPVESLAFSPDGPLLASGGADWSVRLWDVRTGYCVHVMAEHVGPVYTVAFGADGGTLAGAGGDADLLIWNPRNGARQRRVRFENADLSCFLYGPRGELFIGVQGKGGQHMAEVRSGRPNRIATGRVAQICCVALSSGGRVIATGSEKGAVQLWDSASGTELARFEERNGKKPTAVLAVAFSRDGAQLATATDSGKVAIYGRYVGSPPY